MAIKSKTTKIYARTRLKQLKALPDGDLSEALALFRLHLPRTGAAGCVHAPDAELRIQRRWETHWQHGATRYVCRSAGGDKVISVKLLPKTEYARYTAACRAAVAADVPAWLAAERTALARRSAEQIDLDHTGVQFSDVAREFHSTHPSMPPALADGESWALADEDRAAFVALHRLRTRDWRDVHAVTHSAHQRVTAARRREEPSS